MIDDQVLYKKLLNKEFDFVFKNVPDKAEQTCFHRACLAVVMHYYNDRRAAREVLEELKHKHCQGMAEALRLEAEMLAGARSKADFQQLKAQAEKVLSIYPKAGFARYDLASLAFLERDPDTGLQIFDALLADYPDVQSIKERMMPKLLQYRRWARAEEVATQLEDPILKALYRGLLLIVGKFWRTIAWLGIVAVAFLLPGIIKTLLAILLIGLPVIASTLSIVRRSNRLAVYWGMVAAITGILYLISEIVI